MRPLLGVLVMIKGVGVPGFGANCMKVLDDAGTAARSANIPKTDSLFAMLKSADLTTSHTGRITFERI
jgi:hypothetical protein